MYRLDAIAQTQDSHVPFRVLAAKQLLLHKFPQGVEVDLLRDPGTTGNFEVKVNGELVHSKKTGGDGFLHNDKQKQEIVNGKISEAIASSE
uniref:Selenoprotein W n=1 Tax=Chromera velia CCMP2878 TaxID=1169474 RepID=A0A0G4F0G3_9ALVE|eukprot:Cvel_14409.t1-p1 / transcript=Cvel_14409.t1 / gene=Cvel_14409 / organism=Chromera_velia_CCMP2878 / gene_product=Selenoprotein W, putative / transcript_product=Selenoprotein W, putative / location=Cvel_scaffold1024:19606-23407(+) / protein_length=90 / sequence_SO=supercontig / SO=protein_coding / is_pseudo=false